MPAAYLCWASSEVPEMCGTMAFPPPNGFLAVRSGWSRGAGCGNQTSPP